MPFSPLLPPSCSLSHASSPLFAAIYFPHYAKNLRILEATFCSLFHATQTHVACWRPYPFPPLLLVIYAHLATFNKVNNKVKNFCQPQLDAAVEVEAEVACPKNDNWQKFLAQNMLKSSWQLLLLLLLRLTNAYQFINKSNSLSNVTSARHLPPLASWQLEPLRERER